MSTYYREISQHKLLSREEELDLFLEMRDETLPEKQRQAARDKLLTANLRFVFKRAKHFSSKEPELFAELISAGNEGLIVALDKYVPEMGNKFLTYAGAWVDQRILKCMSQQRIVSLPIRKQQIASRITKALEANSDLSLSDLKELMPDVSEKDLRELSATKFLTFYIEELETDTPFTVTPIEDEVDRRLDEVRLHEAVDSLPDLQKKVVTLLYGLQDGVGMKSAEVMEELSISKEVFKKSKKEALASLRAVFGDSNPFA